MLPVDKLTVIHCTWLIILCHESGKSTAKITTTPVYFSPTIIIQLSFPPPPYLQLPLENNRIVFFIILGMNVSLDTFTQRHTTSFHGSVNPLIVKSSLSSQDRPIVPSPGFPTSCMCWSIRHCWSKSFFALALSRPRHASDGIWNHET